MKRLRLVLAGLTCGAVLGIIVGACECPTIEFPLKPGTYWFGPTNTWDYQLVLGEDGRVVETYPDSDGPTRVEYKAGPSGPPAR